MVFLLQTNKKKVGLIFDRRVKRDTITDTNFSNVTESFHSTFAKKYL
jgi:hypothetical protein